MNQRNNRWVIGLCGLMLVLIAAVLYTLPGMIAQINQVQKFRTDFAMRCVNNGGRIITMSKSNVSRVCVSRDGRWLEWY